MQNENSLFFFLLIVLEQFDEECLGLTSKSLGALSRGQTAKNLRLELRTLFKFKVKGGKKK